MPAPTHPTQSHPTQSQPTPPTQQPPAWQPPPSEWGQATNPILPPRPKRRRRIILVGVGLALALLTVGAVAGAGDPSPANAPASKAAVTPAPKPEADRPATLKVGEAGTTVDLLDRPTAEVLVAGVREARDDYGLVDGHWIVASVEVTARRDTSPPQTSTSSTPRGRSSPRPTWPPTAPGIWTSPTCRPASRSPAWSPSDLPAKHGRLVLPHSDGEPQLVWKF